MYWTDMKAGVFNAAVQRLMVALGNDAERVANCLIDKPDFVGKLVRFAKKESLEPDTDYRRAQMIMGKNFFGIEEAVKYFRVDPTKSQWADLAKIPWNEEVLASVKDTHILVVVFSLSIIDIKALLEIFNLRILPAHPCISISDVEIDKIATNSSHKASWQLVRKTPARFSEMKNWWDQCGVLRSTGEEAAKARVMVYTIFGHYLLNGEWLLESGIELRCCDTCGENNHLSIRGYRTGGMSIRILPDNRLSDGIRLSSSRMKGV